MTLDALRQPPAERPDVTYTVTADGRTIPCVEDPSYAAAKMYFIGINRPELAKGVVVLSPRCQQ